MATAKKELTALHKELGVVKTKVSDLECENATLRKEFEKTPKTHAETEAGPSRNLGEPLDNLTKKPRECNAHG